MTKIRITVDVYDGSKDDSDKMGISEDAFNRLSGHTAEHGPGALSWLGEVEEVEKVAD